MGSLGSRQILAGGSPQFDETPGPAEIGICLVKTSAGLKHVDPILRTLNTLKTLLREPRHGYGIVEHLLAASSDALEVGESALYPALQRLLLNGWVNASWGASENNRRARFYTLTASGRRQLEKERATFERRIEIVRRVLEA